MRRGRRKVENPATARRILAAAERHFAAEGMAGARTEEIATAARANKAMLYYYFGNKKRLHRAVLENLFRQLSTAYTLPRKELSPSERLRALVAGYFDFLATHPNYPRLVQRESMESTGNFAWIVRQYLRPFHNQLVRTIQEGIAAGEIRPLNPDHTALSILGMTTSYFAAAPILSEIMGHNLLLPDALEARKTALLDFLDHGLKCEDARLQ
jgi:TetR/AcrR family transcriptional regulator